MTFGQRIKSLRREANMTQESLAELLSISSQAVSRWETDVAMPDISLLPSLANLFNVTTDYLLGMETYQKDLRKAEFDEAFYEYWKHDDKEKNYQIAIRAVAEYPNNMEYVEWLASAEYYVGLPLLDDAEHYRLLESSVKHYKIVIENCTDKKLYDKALFGIVLALHMLHRDQEAKDYAMKIEDEDKRNKTLVWCLEGKEKIEQGQKVAEYLLNDFLAHIRFAGNTIIRCDTVEKILNVLFPDGNYQYYHNVLQYNSLDKARALCSEQRYDDVLAELVKARFHAEQMVKYSKEVQYAFTAPLFNYVKGDKNQTDSEVTDVDDFIGCLNNNRCFDPIRDRKEFQALLLQ